MTLPVPMIRVCDLTYQTSQAQTLLRDISFDVPKGAVLAIAGPNGAGKTTLLNLMTGLQKPTTGDIFIEDKKLVDLNDMQRAQFIAVVSQQSAVDDRLSLEDYIAMGQLPIWSDYSAQEHCDNLKQILDITGLSPLSDCSMGQLSGGEKQRAHIARALAQKPNILFLDEPTNHLDPDAKGRMLSLITSLGITVVMVIHDVVMIPEFATHIALVKDASLFAFGTVEEVQTPQMIHNIFGVSYHLFEKDNRYIPALDIQKMSVHSEGLLK